MSQLTRYYHLLRQLDILRPRMALGDHGNFVNLRPRFPEETTTNPEEIRKKFSRDKD